MYKKEIMKDKSKVEMLDSLRKICNIEVKKNNYFKVIELLYNSVVNLSEEDSTVFSTKFYSQSFTTKDLLNKKPELFKNRKKIFDMLGNSSETKNDDYKNGLDALLRTHTMEEIEAIAIPILNFNFPWGESASTFIDAIYESEYSEDMRKIEDYLFSKKGSCIEAMPGATTSYNGEYGFHVILDDSYEVEASKDTFIKYIRQILSLESSTYLYGFGTLYIKYLYPFLVDKYYKKDISKVDLTKVGYNSLLIRNNFLDSGDFSRYLVDMLINPDLSSEDEKLIVAYTDIINFNLVDKSALRKIKPSFIEKYNLQEKIYSIDPSLFMDELLACKNNMKLRMLAVDLLPKGDKRLASLLSEKTYTLSRVLIQKIPVENLPFMIGSFKGKHKDELEKMVAARMSEEENVIEYMKRING
jgi:hypothetical protein